jgi:hypothetical protein
MAPRLMAPRLTTAALALAGAAIIGVASTVASTDSTSVAAGVGHNGSVIPAVLSLASLGLLGVAMAVPAGRPIFLAIALLGAAWLVGIPDTAAWRSLTAIAGGWLLAIAELAYWSLDFRVQGNDERPIHVRRAATILALVGASILLALIPQLDLSAVPITGIELTAAGLLAAAALVAVAAGMAWRLRPSR